MRRILIATALVAGLATVAVAHAAGGGGSGPRWATVNSCSPAQVGVRASLPGDGSDKQMRVRFTAQYWSAKQRAWLPVAGVPSSPWLDAGSARYSYGQAGWTFQFDPPHAGTHNLVRGVAEMQWLSGGSVSRSASVVTQGGVASDVGGSQASCSL
ncbi:MAG TPA: hypothetical protein VGF21_05340 [Thermoleophilaceae bacterium]